MLADQLQLQQQTQLTQLLTWPLFLLLLPLLLLAVQQML
jgi:hypothetical protein